MTSTTKPNQTKPNRILITAAALCLFTAMVHIIGGGLDTARPLANSSLEDVPRLTLLACWHAISAILLISGPALFLGALPKYQERAHFLVLFIATMWTLFGLCFIAIGLTEPGDNLLFNTIQQWTILLPVGGLAFWGARKNKTQIDND